MGIDEFLLEMDMQLKRGSFKPHKLILLLAVLDLLKEKPVNKISYDEGLKQKFTFYFQMFADERDRNRPYNPFFHLQSDKFWKLVPLRGRESFFAEMKKIGGPGELVQNISHAYLDEPVFCDFIDPVKSEIIKSKITHILMEYKKSCYIKKETFLPTIGAEKKIASDQNISQPAPLFDIPVMPASHHIKAAPSIQPKQLSHPQSSVRYGYAEQVKPAGRETFYSHWETSNPGLSSQPGAGVAEVPGQNMVNEFVDYLNTLSNTTAANENALAESQLSSRFFARVRVVHPLESFIAEQLMNGCWRVVLTGHAGDGKTTLALAVLQNLGFTVNQLTSRLELSGQRLVVIKDMSELPVEQRGQVMQELWQEEERRYLVVSNTGTLLEAVGWLEKNLPQYGLKEDLLKALQADGPYKLANRIMIINAGSIINIDPALEVLKRMLEPQNWSDCQQCIHGQHCPIFYNVRLLQQGWDTVRQRLGLLYRHLYEYGCRLTMRQMVAHLAYALTGGADCRQVAGMVLNSHRAALRGRLFFNRFFGDDGQQEDGAAGQLYAVRRLRQSGYGQILQPALEQRLWLSENRSWSDYPLADELGREIVDTCTKSYNSREKAALRRQMRRLLYFWGTRWEEAGGESERTAEDFIAKFLDSPALFDYLRMLNGVNGFSRLKMRDYIKMVGHVLQEYFTGSCLAQRDDREYIYIPLSRPDRPVPVLFLLARYFLGDFDLALRKTFEVGNYARRALFLFLKDKPELCLELSLPFMDYVARRHRGEMTADLSAFYANRLQRFKAQLIKHYPRLRHQEFLSADGQKGSLIYLQAGQSRRINLEFYAGELEVSFYE